MALDNWSRVLEDSFRSMWDGVIHFSPNIVISVFIFILGWVVAGIISKWLIKIIRSLKVDDALKSLGLQDLVNRAGYRLDSGVFLGGLIRLFIILVFLIASLEVLGLTQVNDFLGKIIIGYIPRVVAAAIVVLLAAWVADIVRNLIIASAKAANLNYAEFLGTLAKWAIWIFAISLAFGHLGLVDNDYALIVVVGIVFMFSLAGGLAFGLGGRDAAAKYIEKVQEDLFQK